MVMGNLTVVVEVIQSLFILDAKYEHRCHFVSIIVLIVYRFQEIYQLGGRKFGFVNMGPLGCLPAMKAIKLQQGGTGECLEEATILVKLHNRALPEVLQKLESKLKGFKYTIFDFYTTAKERMDNPSKYGILIALFILVTFPLCPKLRLCSNRPSQFVSSRFQRSEDRMLRLRSLQGYIQLWRDERNKRVWAMQQCQWIYVLRFVSSYWQGLPAAGWISMEWISQCNKTPQFETTIWI